MVQDQQKEEVIEAKDSVLDAIIASVGTIGLKRPTSILVEHSSVSEMVGVNQAMLLLKSLDNDFIKNEPANLFVYNTVAQRVVAPTSISYYRVLVKKLRNLINDDCQLGVGGESILPSQGIPWEEMLIENVYAEDVIMVTDGEGPAYPWFSDAYKDYSNCFGVSPRIFLMRLSEELGGFYTLHGMIKVPITTITNESPSYLSNLKALKEWASK